MLMNKIDVVFFTCDKYSSLWDDSLTLFQRNFPKENIGKVYLVTDVTPTKDIDKNVNVLVCDSIDFINRMKIVTTHIETDYFLFMLDDYFVHKQTQQEYTDSIFNFLLEKRPHYLKLDVKFKHRLCKSFSYKNLRISKIKTYKPYGIDLYPSIWNVSFLKNIIYNWPFQAKTIWDFEGKLNAINFVSKDQECFCLRGTTFRYIDVIRKGKLRREANRELLKIGIDLTNDWQLMTKNESFKDMIIPYLASITPKTIKRAYKKRQTKKGKTFYSVD